ncbi:tetratricopeptide repeat protein [Desulfobacterales bacterium HSG16]|nr:tetratricopeptide repeat protein [Desulfobacterales bacterium HSG16]
MIQKKNYETTFFNIRCDLLICLFLVIATLAVYVQVRDFSFINYDDPLYLHDRPHVLVGITLDGVIWAFSNIDASNWHPLTWLSHMLDIQLYGMNSGQHHINNVLFHIANTLLLFFVLTRMTRDLWQSSFVAALFALHPLHVESVAWVAERKDVLSTFFWFATMWMYIRYVEHPEINRYLHVLLCFALGLMCKPMLVTLPFVLILMDYWPLRRSSILEKIPFFVLAFILSGVTFFIQKSRGAVVPLEAHPFDMRLINALVSYANYLYKMLWPHELIVIYPHTGTLSLWEAGLACLLLTSISILALCNVKRTPYFAVGWLWYLGTLVPVIGLVQVGVQAMADRYTYVPLIGIFIMIAWGFPDFLKIYNKQIKNSIRKITIVISAISILAACMTVTWFQIQYWRNSVTLFQHVIDVNPHSALAHNSLASGLYQAGKSDEATHSYTEALRIDPEQFYSYFGLGILYINQGKVDKAIENFTRVLSINPGHLNSHLNLGIIYINNGNFNKAVEHYTRALSINPESFKTHTNIGFALNQIGKIEEAIAHFQYALKINPDCEPARNNLDKALETIKAKHSGDE